MSLDWNWGAIAAFECSRLVGHLRLAHNKLTAEQFWKKWRQR